MLFPKARRSGLKFNGALYGEAGSGKTLSALKIARGLAGPDGEIFLIDTENGRGRLYSDDIPGGYRLHEFKEPYTSDRFTNICQEAEKAADGKPGVIIFDSTSSAWEEEGGVILATHEIAERRAKKNNKEWSGEATIGDWKYPKMAHKRMLFRLAAGPLHVIHCLRAHRPIQTSGKTITVANKQVPIQDKNFLYNMLLCLELNADTPGKPILRKCPEMLIGALETPRIEIETGQNIALWLKGNIFVNKGQQKFLNQAAKAAEAGVTAYRRWFEQQTTSNRHYLHRSGKNNELMKLASSKKQ